VLLRKVIYYKRLAGYQLHLWEITVHRALCNRKMRNVEVVERSREDARKHNMRIKMRKDMSHRWEVLKGKEIS